MPLLTHDQLEEKLALIVERLRAAFSPSAIYLFGSYVYGKPTRHSDVDVMVVVEDSDLDAYSRDAKAYRAVGSIGVSKDLQVYTRKEFEERAAFAVSFERTVKQKGRLLYVSPERSEALV